MKPKPVRTLVFTALLLSVVPTVGKEPDQVDLRLELVTAISDSVEWRDKLGSYDLVVKEFTLLDAENGRPAMNKRRIYHEASLDGQLRFVIDVSGASRLSADFDSVTTTLGAYARSYRGNVYHSISYEPEQFDWSDQRPADVVLGNLKPWKFSLLPMTAGVISDILTPKKTRSMLDDILIDDDLNKIRKVVSNSEDGKRGTIHRYLLESRERNSTGFNLLEIHCDPAKANRVVYVRRAASKAGRKFFQADDDLHPSFYEINTGWIEVNGTWAPKSITGSARNMIHVEENGVARLVPVHSFKHQYQLEWTDVQSEDALKKSLDHWTDEAINTKAKQYLKQVRDLL